MSATVFALLALLATVAASNVVTTDWQDCSKPGGFFQVKEVTLTPEPVKPGDLAKFAIDAVSSKDVDGGTIRMVVHYHFVPVWVQNDKLCDKVDSCPIKAGNVTINYSQLFPGITPPGSYSMTLSGHSPVDGDLFCVQISFQVVTSSGSSGGSGSSSGSGLASAAKGVDQQVLRTHRKEAV